MHLSVVFVFVLVLVFVLVVSPCPRHCLRFRRLRRYLRSSLNTALRLRLAQPLLPDRHRRLADESHERGASGGAGALRTR